MGIRARLDVVRRKRYQLLSLLFLSTTLILGFQNCAPNMAACEGENCALSNASKTSTTRSMASSTAPTATSTTGASMANASGGSSSSSGSMASSSTGSSSSGGASLVGASGGTSTSTSSNYQMSGASSSGDTVTLQSSPRDQSVTEGDTLYLSAYATSTYRPPSYQWYKEGQAIQGATSSSYEVRNLTAGAAGHYYVIASDGRGSARSAEIEIKVRAARNPCLAGKYGRSPYVNTPAGAEEHESLISAYYATSHTFPELQDSYSTQVSCSNSSSGADVRCTGAQLWQCQNARMVKVMDSCSCFSVTDSHPVGWGG